MFPASTGVRRSSPVQAAGLVMRSPFSWRRMVLASRNEDRTRHAAHRVRTAVPGANVEAMHLDLAELPTPTKGGPYAGAN